MFYSTQLEEGLNIDLKYFGFNKACDQIFPESHVSELEEYDLNKINWLYDRRTQRVLTTDQCKLKSLTSLKWRKYTRAVFFNIWYKTWFLVVHEDFLSLIYVYFNVYQKISITPKTHYFIDIKFENWGNSKKQYFHKVVEVSITSKQAPSLST